MPLGVPRLPGGVDVVALVGGFLVLVPPHQCFAVALAPERGATLGRIPAIDLGPSTLLSMLVAAATADDDGGAAAEAAAEFVARLGSPHDRAAGAEYLKRQLGLDLRIAW